MTKQEIIDYLKNLRMDANDKILKLEHCDKLRDEYFYYYGQHDAILYITQYINENFKEDQ